MFASGWVEKIFPSSTEGVFTIWLCSLDEGVEFSRKASKSCIEPVFLLYELDRGPELKENDSIVVAGVITGSRKKTPSRGEVSNTNPAWQTVILSPTISVIKAALID